MHYTGLETFLKLLDEKNQKKLRDLQLISKGIANDVFLQNLEDLSSEIMTIDKDILKYTNRIQKKQILQNAIEISDNVTVSENNDNLNLETQKKLKNKCINHLSSSQKLKEEKTGNKINETTELEVESSSIEWDYVDTNKQYMDFQAIYNFKLSADHFSFGKMKEILNL